MTTPDDINIGLTRSRYAEAPKAFLRLPDPAGREARTSYTGPRVAAAMANLHQLNPSLGVERVDNMVSEITRRMLDNSDLTHG